MTFRWPPKCQTYLWDHFATKKHRHQIGSCTRKCVKPCFFFKKYTPEEGGGPCDVICYHLGYCTQKCYFWTFQDHAMRNIFKYELPTPKTREVRAIWICFFFCLKPADRTIYGTSGWIPLYSIGITDQTRICVPVRILNFNTTWH